MDLKTMSAEELLARKSEIAAEVDSLEDMEAVQTRSAEIDAINAEIARKREEFKDSGLWYPTEDDDTPPELDSGKN